MVQLLKIHLKMAAENTYYVCMTESVLTTILSSVKTFCAIVVIPGLCKRQGVL